MNIICGNCGERHGSVYVVKTCHQISDRIARAEALLAKDEDGQPVWCTPCGEYVASGRGWFHVRCSLILDQS